MTPRNKVQAAVLAFFLGAVGAHKFYLKDSGGIIFFIFLLMMSLSIGLPISFLFGVFDGFKLLNMSNEEFEMRYNRGMIRRVDPVLERRRMEQMRKYESEDNTRPYSHRSINDNNKQRSNAASALKVSGLSKYKEFDIEGAIGDFKKGLEINPDDVALHFNIACAYSLTEKKEMGFVHLNKAVLLGFNDFERIQTHDDLAFLRIQPEFDDFKKSGYRIVPFLAQKPVSQEEKEELLLQLNRLKELKEKGVLSQEEYVIESKKIMVR